MKKLLIFILFPIIGLTQEYNLNAYKYVVVSLKADPLDIGSTVKKELNSYGIITLNESKLMPADFVSCHALYCELIYKPYETMSQIVKLKFKDCKGNLITESQSGCAVCAVTVEGELRKASIKAVGKIGKLRKYNYDPKVLEHSIPRVELTNETESSLTSYYDNNNLHNIEGIYKSTEDNGNSYTVGIKKFGKIFKAIIIKADYEHWKEGEVKFLLNQTATKNLYSCSYFMGNKLKKEIFLIVENPGLLTFNLSNEYITNFIKMYPINSNLGIDISNENWIGNGSGIFISNNGYIVTNNHVIENANSIEVEVKSNEDVKHYNAKIVKTDVNNDLAIIQIEDPNFNNFKSIPYNFKTRISDVGSEVYALGYPKALTLMGKDIKFTDGRISSKTGFQGDITSYQTTTPIQPGNSGGPLFDHNGNLLGINSAKIVSDDVEGVSYTIKTSYLLNLIDVLPESIPIPNSTWVGTKPLTEQIKILSNYVVLIKVR